MYDNFYKKKLSVYYGIKLLIEIKLNISEQSM